MDVSESSYAKRDLIFEIKVGKDWTDQPSSFGPQSEANKET